jgi:hypothetical protein
LLLSYKYSLTNPLSENFSVGRVAIIFSAGNDKRVRGNYKWSKYGSSVSQNGCKTTVEKKCKLDNFKIFINK